MSSIHCSLALDEDISIEQQGETSLTLIVNERCALIHNEQPQLHNASEDVIELGGTITVSF